MRAGRSRVRAIMTTRTAHRSAPVRSRTKMKVSQGAITTADNRGGHISLKFLSAASDNELWAQTTDGAGPLTLNPTGDGCETTYCDGDGLRAGGRVLDVQQEG